MSPDEIFKWLEEFNRKGYRFKIASGGNFQPGDGVHVELSCSWMDKSKEKDAGKSLIVSEEELTRFAEFDGGKDYFPTITDVITEAIKQWDALKGQPWTISNW